MIILTSPEVVAPGGVPIPELVQILRSLRASNQVGIVSNHVQPPWFDAQFSGSHVQFLPAAARQQGGFIASNAAKLGVKAHDTFVLAGNDADIQMAKNGGAILLAAAWSGDAKVKDLGIQLADPTEFAEAMRLHALWPGGWWFECAGPKYRAMSLSNLSGKGGVSNAQVEFADYVTDLVKQGGPRLWALLACTARSLLVSGFGARKRTMWGVFPSSSSKNNDTDVLSDFTHRLRTTVVRDHFAKRGYPLFIRHQPAGKRSLNRGRGNRTDPAEQLETVHINPEYRGKVQGRHVVVVDDCITYGLSFGVSAALLLAAGAASVSGVALGKFGNQFNLFDIKVKGDPFAPLRAGDYTARGHVAGSGTTNTAAQGTLIELFK